MSELSIPNTVANGTAADGNEVGANFDAIQSWANAHVLEKGGGTMTGSLTLSDDPASALQAATKQYVDAAASGAVTSANATAAAALAANKPVSVFSRAAAQSIGGGGDAISFDTETQDASGWGTVTTSTLTCPATGVYMLAGMVDYASWPSLSQIFIRVNGNDVSAANNAVNASPWIYYCWANLYLTAGDTVQLWATQSSGSPINATARLAIMRAF